MLAHVLDNMPGAPFEHAVQCRRTKEGRDLDPVAQARSVRQLVPYGLRACGQRRAVEFHRRYGCGSRMVEVRAAGHPDIARGDLDDVIRERPVRPVAVGELVVQIRRRELCGQPRRGRQGVVQPAEERDRRQRRVRVVVEAHQCGDLREVNARHPPRAVGDDGDSVRTQRSQAVEGVAIIGDVPGGEVDRTDRQEFLNPQATGSARLPIDFDHSNCDPVVGTNATVRGGPSSIRG